MVNNPLVTNAEDIRDLGSIPGSGRSPGGRHGDPLQYSFLENFMDRGDWWATVCGVIKSWTLLSNLPCSYTQKVSSHSMSWITCVSQMKLEARMAHHETEAKSQDLSPAPGCSSSPPTHRQLPVKYVSSTKTFSACSTEKKDPAKAWASQNHVQEQKEIMELAEATKSRVRRTNPVCVTVICMLIMPKFLFQ